MKVFTADIGNSREKLAVFTDGKLSFSASDRTACLQLLETASEKDVCILSSSGNSDLIPVLKNRFTSRCLVVNPGMRLPVKLNIEHPETLGTDRIALVCGAQSLFPGKNSLVIAAGSCITFNLLTAEGEFRGGRISPGILMRFRAMHTFTAGLPDLQPDFKQSGILGNNTYTAMQYGVLEGVCAEVMDGIAAFRREFSELQVILTGGDAPFLASRIKNGIFADPDLLMKGLYQIYCSQ